MSLEFVRPVTGPKHSMALPAIKGRALERISTNNVSTYFYARRDVDDS